MAMVQGHVDDHTQCLSVTDLDGSWSFVFRLTRTEALAGPQGQRLHQRGKPYDRRIGRMVLRCYRDPSLMSTPRSAIWEAGDRVNIEFDVLGKYVERILARPVA